MQKAPLGLEMECYPHPLSYKHLVWLIKVLDAPDAAYVTFVERAWLAETCADYKVQMGREFTVMVYQALAKKILEGTAGFISFLAGGEFACMAVHPCKLAGSKNSPAASACSLFHAHPLLEK